MRLPFVALPGLGETAARAIYDAMSVAPFNTVEEIQARAGVNKTAIEVLRAHGALDGLPDTDQLSLF